MSGWLVVWLVIGLVSTVALVATIAFLAYHGLLLVRTARRVQEELQPIADELVEEADAVNRRVASMQLPAGSGARRGRR